MGTWGLWLTVVVLTTFVAGLAAAPLYLETGEPGLAGTGAATADGSWPPEGVSTPPPGHAAGALALLVVAAAALSVARRQLVEDRARTALALVTAAAVALAGGSGLLLADLRGVGFRWDEHAYTSVYWVLTGATLTLAAVSLLLVGAVLVQLLTGVVDGSRHLELSNTVRFVWSSVGLAVVMLGLVHVHPLVVGGT